ncbi:MAG: MopE-related protein [bacterium]|nr:MopE-related protein [bacterium]
MSYWNIDWKVSSYACVMGRILYGQSVQPGVTLNVLSANYTFSSDVSWWRSHNVTDEDGWFLQPVLKSESEGEDSDSDSVYGEIHKTKIIAVIDGQTFDLGTLNDPNTLSPYALGDARACDPPNCPKCTNIGDFNLSKPIAPQPCEIYGIAKFSGITTVLGGAGNPPVVGSPVAGVSVSAMDGAMDPARRTEICTRSGQDICLPAAVSDQNGLFHITYAVDVNALWQGSVTITGSNYTEGYNGQRIIEACPASSAQNPLVFPVDYFYNRPGGYPNAPEGVTSIGACGELTNLVWTDRADNEDGIRIERREGDGNWMVLADLAANTAGHPDSITKRNTNYCYRVIAYRSIDGTALESPSRDYCLTTPNQHCPPPPPSPSNLAGSAIPSQVSLTWKEKDREIGYKIAKRQILDGPCTEGGAGLDWDTVYHKGYVEVAVTGENTGSYSDPLVSAGACYCYRVFAYNEAGNSGSSNPACLVVPYCNEGEVGTCYTGPAGTADIGECRSGQKICSNGDWGPCLNEVLPRNEVCDGMDNNCDTLVDDGVKDVFYRDADGDSWGDSTKPVYACYAPAGYVSRVGDCADTNPYVHPGSAEICDGVNDENCSGAVDEGCSCVNGATRTCGSSAVGECRKGTQTCASGGWGPCIGSIEPVAETCDGKDNDCDGKTDEVCALAPSGLFAVVLSSSRIQLGWNDNSTNEEGFRVERKLVGWSYAQIGSAPADSIIYGDANFEYNTGYYYRIYSFNSAGDSDYSNEVYVMSPDHPMGVPANLVASAVSSSQINLSWADKSDNENGFKIERKTGATGTYSVVATLPADSASFSDSNLISGTTYFYRVYGYNSLENSGYSNVASTATDPPSAPTELHVVPIDSSRIDVTWQDNSGDELGFKLEQKVGANGTYGLIATLPAGSTFYSDLGLTQGDVFYYRVYAYGSERASDYSNEALTATRPLSSTISGGYQFACALTTAGGVKCWGYNYYGQLGNGEFSNGSSVPVDVVGLSSGAVAVANGFQHTCALTSAGGVKCWGDNYFWQLGYSDWNGPQVCGDEDGCSMVPIDMVGLSSGVIALAAGCYHTCALLDTGGVKCWGANWSGELGDGTTNDNWIPVDVSGLSPAVKAITAGCEHTCALMETGGVKCWGSNFSGELGVGSSTVEKSVVPADVVGLAGGVVAIDATEDGMHSCALLDTGGVKCWGNNRYGQLGIGNASGPETCYWGDICSTTPMDVVGLSSGVSAVTTEWKHSCALTDSGGMKCWGDNERGELGNGATAASYTPVAVSGLSSGAAVISASDEGTCAVLTGGGIRCWGDNSYGQAGDGTWALHSTAVNVAGLAGGISEAMAGDSFSCSLSEAGGVKCWGNNGGGQLGDGTIIARNTPVDVIGLSSGVIALATGGDHSCALLNTGGVKCWGYNYVGQLGVGTYTGPEICGDTACSTRPVAIPGLASGVTAIAAGDSHACAILGSGAVKCWGYNSYGQLGIGNKNGPETCYSTLKCSTTPIAVPAISSGAKSLALGYGHSCALLSTGGVKCWGENMYSQVGDGTTTDRMTPVNVYSLTSGVASISAGGDNACAILNSGIVRCWGDNSDGQIGTGSLIGPTTCMYKPCSGIPMNVLGLGTGVNMIDVGSNGSACVVTTSGGIKCWGKNTDDQLGIGIDSGPQWCGEGYSFCTPSPMDAIGLNSGMLSVSAGAWHSCAVTDTGMVKCWGNNWTGALGDGSLGYRTTPVDVVGMGP